MKSILKLGSYLFNPLWICLLASLFYFWVTPRAFPISIIEAKILAIAILSLFIPLIFIFLLKNVKLIKTSQLKTPKERRLVLLFFALMILTLNNFILNTKFPELYYFFFGILLSAMISFCLTFIKYKISLHSIGVSALLGFVVSLSALYSLNTINLIAFLILALGWIASSRLIEKRNSIVEIILGFLVGGMPQILFFIAILIHYKT